MDEGSGLCKALRAGLAWANTYTLLAIISNKKFISEGMQTGAGAGVTTEGSFALCGQGMCIL